MEPPREPRRAAQLPLEPLEAVVPPRAVLTELARGFLLLHERDPTRASQFAATFLREQAGHPLEPPVRPSLPSVRRTSAVWSAGER
ncbi:MAG TPA: hypothetical protein VEY07_08805 [Thermoplasmata archaeon]|nr:hypothetical protein [Thermoplasmata archaeon]